MPLEIMTERQGIVLRQFVPSDARPLFELIDCNRSHLSQHLDETSAKYPDYESVLQNIVEPPQPERLRFGVWDKEELVGALSLHPMSRGTELGYWIGSQYTGRGYATAAARAACAYAIQELKVTPLVAFTHKDNLVSQNVLRRCGFEGGHRASFTADTALAFRRTA